MAMFEPGQSGNPNGRPIGSRNRGTLVIEKLLAAQMSVEGMSDYINADSLAFISTDGLYRAMGEAGRDRLSPRFCDACFTGDYPIPLADVDDGKVSVQLSLLADTA